MAFKTFAPGVLTSSDVNTFLMRQAVITCTSSTRPASPSEGMTIYETDTDALAIYTGSAWKYRGYYEDYTPTVGGAWTLGNGEVIGRYAVIGDVVHLKGALYVGSTTSLAASGSLEISYPSGLSPSTAGSTPSGADSRRGQLGRAVSADDSLGTFFEGVVVTSSPVMLVDHYVVSAYASIIGRAQMSSTQMPFTVATGDYVRWSATYEAA
jgi:hypothetical protein